MKRLHVNIITVLLALGCFYNLLATKGFLPGIPTPKSQIEIIYDISLAFFAGTILYLTTSALPFFFEQKGYRERYKNSFIRFYENSKARLEKIDYVDLTKTKAEVKVQFKELKYNDKVKDNARNTIYTILMKIANDKQNLYRDCLPFISAAGDSELLENFFKMLDAPLFDEFKREYLRKNPEELNNIGIGGLIKDFYDQIEVLKNEMY